MANANGNGKINLSVAKGALAGAAAAYMGGDKGWKSEEAFRDAIRAVKKAGGTETDCASVIGAAVLNSVDRYGDAKPIGVSEDEPRGLARVLSKISSAKGGGRFFAAGFAAAISGRSRKS